MEYNERLISMVLATRTLQTDSTVVFWEMGVGLRVRSGGTRSRGTAPKRALCSLWFCIVGQKGSDMPWRLCNVQSTLYSRKLHTLQTTACYIG